MLCGVQEDWEPVVLELKAHKDSGTHILTGTTCEEIQALLDDHIIKSQTMAASRWVPPRDYAALLPGCSATGTAARALLLIDAPAARAHPSALQVRQGA